jgi:hypothetical protein
MNIGLPSYDLLMIKKTVKGSALSFHANNADDRFLGPYFLSPRLTADVYHDFLQNFLPELLQDVDLQTGINLWFMHDNILLIIVAVCYN